MITKVDIRTTNTCCIIYDDDMRHMPDPMIKPVCLLVMGLTIDDKVMLVDFNSSMKILPHASCGPFRINLHCNVTK